MGDRFLVFLQAFIYNINCLQQFMENKMAPGKMDK